uniref:Alcohol dehydrogenase n=1 Tax=Stomoxys calcitrans TaxID=35570 RepID=A0A1I8PUB1_STOCA
MIELTQLPVYKRPQLRSIISRISKKIQISFQGFDFKMFEWSAKNVVYVGAFSGIGYQVCQMLMKKPIKFLVVCSRMENVEMLKKLQDLNRAVSVVFVQINITEHTSIDHAIKTIIGKTGYVDVLINGVGVLADKDVETTVSVNLTGMINTTLMMMPWMDKSQSGHGGMVVNIASVYGLEPGPAFSVYAAAKHGVIGFTRSMADDNIYQKTGVAFLCICPGMTSTELMMNKRDMNWVNWVPHSQPIWNSLKEVKMQTPQECAANVVQAMEKWKNGGIYICSKGGMKEVVWPVHWQI